WVCTERHGNGEGFARVRFLPLLKIQGAATVAQPTHNEAITADKLLAINAEVLPFFVGPAGDDERPSDQWACIAGPAGLNGEVVEVYPISFKHHFLARGFASHFRVHRQYFCKHRRFG